MLCVAGLFLMLISALSTAVHAGPVDDVMRVITAAAPVKTHIDLAAHLETEGHWSFANRAGEKFIASGPVELQRGLTALAPEAQKGAQKLTIHLSQSTLFRDAKAFAALPKEAALRVVVGRQSYPVVMRAASPPLVQISPTLSLASSNEAAFFDALWHVTRPLPRMRIRVVGFEPGGPNIMSSAPRFEPDTKKALVDQIDPQSLATALSGARSQVVIMTGRVDGNQLVTRGRTGKDTAIALAQIEQAAAASDVTAITLHAGTATQPGGRNWLWLPVDVPGLDSATGNATLADILSVVAGKRPLIAAAEAIDGRTVLRVRSSDIEDGVFSASRWTKALTDLTGDLLGKSPARMITVSLPSAARQQELDRRVLKSIPSVVQWGYAALLLLGLLGAPAAWRWWSRLWPQEHAGEYANAAGFHAARAARAAIFAVVFAPLAAIVSVPATLLRLMSRTA